MQKSTCSEMKIQSSRGFSPSPCSSSHLTCTVQLKGMATDVSHIQYGHEQQGLLEKQRQNLRLKRSSAAPIIKNCLSSSNRIPTMGTASLARVMTSSSTHPRRAVITRSMQVTGVLASTASSTAVSVTTAEFCSVITPSSILLVIATVAIFCTLKRTGRLDWSRVVQYWSAIMAYPITASYGAIQFNQLCGR